MNKKCIGCGATLQTENLNKVGYTDEEMYEKSDVCRRCFRIRNYGDFLVVEKNKEYYVDILKKVAKTDDLIVYIIDPFNIEPSINSIQKYIKRPCLIVLSKRDILPKSIKDKNFIKYIEDSKVDYIDIILTSSMNNYNIDKLYKKICKHKTSDKVYFVGNTNAGKSTLINKMIKNYSDNKSIITTSVLPGTTLDTIDIILNDDLTLVDTPGLVEDDNIVNFMHINELKAILPKGEIKPKTYQIYDNKSLIIEDICRIDYLEGETNSFTLYISNYLNVDYVNYTTNREMTRKLKEHHFELLDNEDIVINGIGWIKVTKKGSIDVYTVDKVSVYKRRNIV